MDWRIVLLRYGADHPLMLNVVFTTVFGSIGVIALILEREKECERVNLRLWLALTLIRLTIRCVLFSYIETMPRNYMRLDGNALVFQKFVDLIDLFGIIWFAVGNLLVFNNSVCVHSVPWTFSVSLAFIAGTYIYVFFPICLKFSLGLCPSAEDLGPWVGRYLLTQENDDDDELSTVQRDRWKVWLERYNCFEYPYGSSNQPAGGVPPSTNQSPRPCDKGDDEPIRSLEEGGIVGSAKHSQKSDATLGQEACSICLQPFSTPPTAEETATTATPIANPDAVQQPSPPEGQATAAVPSSSSSPSLRPQPLDMGSLATFQRCTAPTPPAESVRSAHAVSQVVPIDQDSNSSDDEGSHAVQPINDTNLAAAEGPPTLDVESPAPRDLEQPPPPIPAPPVSILVCYPCSAHHVFHAICLHRWLQVSYERHGNDTRITCPCCRQPPSRVPTESPAHPRIPGGLAAYAGGGGSLAAVRPLGEVAPFDLENR